MTDTDLDQSYTALCHALADVGEDKAPLLLSMLCLQLMARSTSAADVLPLIAIAREQAGAE
jgi:hypothetical protein